MDGVHKVSNPLEYKRVPFENIHMTEGLVPPAAMKRRNPVIPKTPAYGNQPTIPSSRQKPGTVFGI